jgi:two-component system response regulator FixJ
MSEMAFVHVIDDDPAVRDALTVLLAAGGHPVKAYASAEDFLARLAGAPPGCVVTDVHMPGLSGLDLLRRMEDRLADFPTIVLTGRADVPLAVQALKAGAADFLEKPFEPGAMLEAVQAVLGRRAQATARTAEQQACAQRLAGLSARERDVLKGLVAGWSNKTIARELEISPRTVESYRANVMMKMQAQSLSELVRMTLLSGPDA